MESQCRNFRGITIDFVQSLIDHSFALDGFIVDYLQEMGTDAIILPITVQFLCRPIPASYCVVKRKQIRALDSMP